MKLTSKRNRMSDLINTHLNTKRINLDPRLLRSKELAPLILFLCNNTFTWIMRFCMVFFESEFMYIPSMKTYLIFLRNGTLPRAAGGKTVFDG